MLGMHDDRCDCVRDRRRSVRGFDGAASGCGAIFDAHFSVTTTAAGRLLTDIYKGQSVAELTPLVRLAERLVLDALARTSDVDDCARMATHFVSATTTGIYGAVVSGRVSDWLHKCGLSGPKAKWPKGLHSCMPLSEWRDCFGDESLIVEIRGWLAGQIKQSELLVPLLANDTMGNLPPLTFFSRLVLAFDGTERRDLDLVGTALHPISDAARVFALAAGWTNGC